MKRAVKTPKVYFLDTGLAAYLTKWKNKDVLEAGTMSGNFFENYVIVEIIKSYYNNGELRPPVYFYRDKEQREIDLIIEQNGKLHPIEIKKTALPSKDMISNFKAIEKVKEIGEGAIICMYDKITNLDEVKDYVDGIEICNNPNSKEEVEFLYNYAKKKYGSVDERQNKIFNALVQKANDNNITLSNIDTYDSKN